MHSVKNGTREETTALLTPDQVFQLHPKIRWASLSAKGRVVFSEMREGVESYTSDSEDRTFMELGPVIMSGLAERLTPDSKAGELECVMVCFEKDCILLAKVGDDHLAVSVDKSQALTVFQEIMPEIQKLAASA